jgi:excisionase family DNA binding protein
MKDLLNTTDIAHMYRVTSATVLNWVHAGKLKAYTTPGGHYRVARIDLEAFARVHIIPPTAEWAPPSLRLLLIGADAEVFERLRSATVFRWPGVQVEHARTEFEVGWWMARLRPTHIAIHPSLTPTELVNHCRRLAGSDAAYSLTVVTLPKSPEDGLGEWIDQLPLNHA